MLSKYLSETAKDIAPNFLYFVIFAASLVQKSVAFYTLGCKLNFSETSTIARQLEKQGLYKKEFTESADIYVINTCSVTDHADRKCKKVVKEALKYNPEAFIVIVGCYAQLKPQEIAEIEGVDLVLGASEKFNLPEHLKEISKKNPKTKIVNSIIKETNVFVPGFSIGDRTRSFLKVQDGCDYFCTFCTIPLARGKSRSHSIAETLKVANELAETNVKEVVLTGVNLGDFGITNNETFYDLIVELDKIKGIERYRISSIEPNLLEDRIIEFVAESNKFAPHFHIPLQSGSDKILKSMRRKYDAYFYEQKINHIRKILPDASIGVDVICGFPGETEEDFKETYSFLNELDISYLHVFPYSERSNTGAVKIKEKVHQYLRNERTEILRILSEKKKNLFYRKYIGSEMCVLFENEEKNTKMYGFTQNYIKVEMDYDPLLINEMTSVKISGMNSENIAQGEIIHYKLLNTYVS